MEVWWFIIAAAWVGSLLICGSACYRRGLNAKRMVIESLTFKQAMKLWQIHELIRHEDDKRNIRKDLAKLADVEMPKGIDYKAWFDVR